MNTPIANIGTGGLLTYEDLPNRIVGKVMEIIEATGLPSKQEESVKSLIKKVIYEELSYPNTIWVEGEKHWSMREEYMKNMSQASSTSHPTVTSLGSTSA